MNDSRLIAAAILVAILASGGRAVAQVADSAAPPSRIGPIWDGQKHQPKRGVTEPAPAERRGELQELNKLSRELLPSGSPVPAPDVATFPSRR